MLALGLLPNCAVQIKEEDFYSDAGPDGAIISHFYDPSTSRIGKAAWDSMREGFVCVSPDAITDIKTEIEELCSKESCSEPVMNKIHAAEFHLQAAQKQALK